MIGDGNVELGDECINFWFLDGINKVDEYSDEILSLPTNLLQGIVPSLTNPPASPKRKKTEAESLTKMKKLKPKDKAEIEKQTK